MIIQLYKQFYVSILVQDGAIQMHYGSYKILKLYKKDESSSSVFYQCGWTMEHFISFTFIKML